MWVEDWAPRAACKGTTPDQLFVRGAEQNKAKQLCTGCPVRTECLAEALDNQIEWGVWGGVAERERRTCGACGTPCAAGKPVRMACAAWSARATSAQRPVNSVLQAPARSAT